MKSLFGSFVVDGRGKVNGHVMTKARSGSTIRTKVTPANRRSNTQQTVRSNLTYLSRLWASLTATQRAAWNAAVDSFKGTNIFGDIVRPSGFNLYVRLNSNLLQIEIPVISTPPEVSDVGQVLIDTLVCDVSDSNVEFTFAPDPLDSGTGFIVEATPQLSAGVSAPGNNFKVINYYGDSATGAINVFNYYTAVFGSLVAGTKIFVRLTPINFTSGIKGTPSQLSAVVTA